MIVAETLDTPWTQFYDQVSAAMDKTYQLDDAVLGYLDTQLQKRLQQVRTQMLLLVAALAVVFAAILYLYGGFYVSTRATLKDLGRMMERVAGGDMTVSFQARSRDELGELGQSFNESVAKIHDLIERVSQTVGEVERQTLRVESVSAEQPGGSRATQPDRAGGHGDEPDGRYRPGSGAQRGDGGEQREQREPGNPQRAQPGRVAGG